MTSGVERAVQSPVQPFSQGLENLKGIAPRRFLPPAMVSRFKKLLASLLFAGSLQFPSGAAPHQEETFLFYGNSLVERLMEEGELEACLQLARPRSGVVVRSLAWTGDEVGYRLRPEGYTEHMKGLLAQWPAQTVVIGFGNNEAFGGDAGLAQFRTDWNVYLREIRRLHPGARLVLLSPVPSGAGNASGAAERKRSLLSYANATEEIA